MSILLTCSNCRQTIESNRLYITTDLMQCTRCKLMYLISVIPTNLMGALPEEASLQVNNENDDRIILSLPRMKISTSHFFQLLFVSTWFSSALFLTWLLYQIWPLGIILTLPLWLVEISTIAGLLNASYETQTLTIHPTFMLLEKKRPLFSEKLMVTFPSIREISMSPLPSRFTDVFIKPQFMWKLRWSGNAPIIIPAIHTDLGVLHFFESASEKEQKWVISFLNRKIELLQQTN
ncbi:MAG: hypothetical protein K1X81_11395 [Bacteroidia bacterium]|nr:hypothetical protein [Bacteroidia bacterium]